MTDKNKKTKNVEKEIIARRDFVICQNEHYYEIKEGDNVKELGIPSKFYDNLKTEKVI